MSKIKGESYIEWKYVPTKENPADFGNRGCEICKLDNEWWEVPKWLQYQTQWPEQPKIENFKESDIEKIKIKEILATILTKENMFDTLLSKFSLLKTLRVLSWISRFLSNSRNDRLKGPLTTNELMKQRKLIIRKVQLQYSNTQAFKIN